MLERIPTVEELTALIGEQHYAVWAELCKQIDAN